MVLLQTEQVNDSNQQLNSSLQPHYNFFSTSVKSDINYSSSKGGAHNDAAICK